MAPTRRQWLGWGGLALAAAAALLWLARLDLAQAVSTDVLDLIPVDERAPELALVRQLASQAEARTMLFALTAADGGPAPRAAAGRLAVELGREASFDQALALHDLAPYEALGRELFARRFDLLFPRWLQSREAAWRVAGGTGSRAERIAADAVAELERFLAQPEALAFQELVPADPLLLLPTALEQLRRGLAGPPVGTTGAPAPALVWARLAASPLSEAGQGPAFAAIARAAAAVAAEFPGVTVEYTGINRFAAASRARIEREVAQLNLLSLAAVLAVALAFLRDVWRGLHFVPVVLLSLLAAWTWTTLAFERMHVLVFVIGSLLTGVAIDYGFYLFLQPPETPGETYGAKVRRLASPLLASCLTTVAGFALLLCSELPLLRQLAVFVGTGLVSALGIAVVYFATVADPYLPTRRLGAAPLATPVWRRRGRAMLAVVWLLALPGLARLEWRDDIRELEIPSPELKANDLRLRAWFGERPDRTVYLTHGATLAEARESLARFEDWLAVAGGGGAETFGLGRIVPTAGEHERARQFVREEAEFPARLRAALAARGFDAGGFAPFFEAYAKFGDDAAGAGGRVAAMRAVQAGLAGPVALLVHDSPALAWFVTVAGRAPAVAPPAELHTVAASQLQSLNRIFARYRQSAGWYSVGGLAIVGAGVLLMYGWRHGARIFAIPGGACLGIFGAFGWCGQPLNLFHLLGAFLGVCLTHNYSIFTATSAFRREPPPASVRLSALTTAASFGVLATSGIPVVRALGMTVALMVLLSLAMIECEQLSGLGRKR
jgi:predicted exporter